MNKIRPQLPNLIKDKTTDLEKFQNDILRPIIKMQHKLLIHHFIHYQQKRKVNFESFTADQKRKRVQGIFKKDIALKKMFLGFIVGHFTEKEYLFYVQYDSEINKRILQITAQRINDSLHS